MIQECSTHDTHSEERWLRQCLRDLIAFTSLPLLWKDKTPREIADDLAAVLESTLGAEFVLVRITGPFAEEPIDAARAARRYPEIDAHEVSKRVAPLFDLECEERAIAVPNPIGSGELQISLSPVGFLKEYGVVLVGGSRAHGFPTTRDKLLMNVASNQAAALLETVALRMRERELQAELREMQQKLLLKSEEKYRDLIDLSPDAIFVVDSEGNCVSGNPAGLELLKCTAQELTGMPVTDTYLPEERGAFRSRLEGIKAGNIMRFERTFLRADGSTLPAEISASPMRDGNFQTVVRDISERKRSEAALAKAFEEIQILKDQLQTENIALREEIDKASMFEEIIGTSAILQAVLSRLSKVAPTDSSVLITGETGTGKELIARAIHSRSPRSSRAFVTVNCAVIPHDLIASELFGHEKGAFTGATQRRLGRFELAQGGTIFLDEIGELPAETQIALLRVLQEHEFERVGGTHSIRTDVRLIAATNRDLDAAIAVGTFRSDLFYRLNVFPIEIPPLRERREDIPLLVEYFIDRYARKAGKQISGVNKKSLDLLQGYPWPGNIRELQNVIERSVIVSSGDVFFVDESWLSKESSQPPFRVQAPQSSEGELRGEREIIEAALAESRGRVAGPSGAAAKLGIPPTTLDSKIKALKIRKSQFKFR
ncbi:MAG TPA: sigma 54-interacting transcriptional regulator [Bryobacteraceae bacterium]|nr:sigma 54-interacting transcriptional regulator [Bryobacteraceae bacterium]